MNQTLLSSLLADIRTDFSNPYLLWQVVALCASLFLGWAVARWLQGRLAANEVRLDMTRFGGEQSFTRVVSALMALCFITLSKVIIEHWHHANLLRMAIALSISFATIRLAFYILRRIFARTGSAGKFLQMFEKVFATLVWICVALYIIGVWPDLVAYLEDTTLPIGRNKVSLSVILQAAASVAFTLMIALWIGAVLEERLMHLEAMHTSLRAVLARMGRAVLILIAVLISLSLVGIDLTVLSVFSGALGVGLGLGLQKLAANYVSGFVVLLERSLSIGDVVTVDKYSGTITQINTRYTIVRGGDGTEAVVPNEMLVSGVVQNFSLSDRTLRITTPITVGYQTDIDLVLRLLEETAADNPQVSVSPPPLALLVRFGADGFELELAFSIADLGIGRGNVLSDVNRAIWKALQKHRIEVPHPQREVRLLGQNSSEKNGDDPMFEAAAVP